MDFPFPSRLRGNVLHYPWGGHRFIPELLGIPPSNKPCAELWLGAHPKNPALAGKALEPLDRLIAKHPEKYLGSDVAKRFGNRLPYLLKILDVEQMLSIQVHPEKQAAERGFEEENRKGIPLDAPHRNYKDRNHKPELMVARSDFWLIHGFKPLEEGRDTCRSIPELHFLLALLEGASDYQKLYQALMRMPQDKIDRALEPLMRRILPQFQAGKVDKSEPNFWAARAALTLPPAKGKYDRGIFSLYLFNLLNLSPGQGIFQGAGIPHAYLEGRNIELMANSDNVLRGGLSPKHIDIGELLAHTSCRPVKPQVLRGEKHSASETLYPVSCPDFMLGKIELAAGTSHESKKKHSLEIVVAMEGENICLSHAGGQISLRRGEAFMAPADLPYRMSCGEKEHAVLFRAGVPLA